MSRELPYQRCALFLVMSGLISSGPAIWALIPSGRRLQPIESAPVEAWAALLLFMGLAQIIYAVFVAQLRHPIALRVTSVVCLVLATASAVCLGGTIFDGNAGWTTRWLQIHDPDWASHGPRLDLASIWCLLLVCVQTSLSVWSASASARQSAMSAALDSSPMPDSAGQSTVSGSVD